MRLVIFPLVLSSGIVQYPDDRSLFRGCKISSNDVIGYYSGTDDSILDYVETPAPVIPITITSITGALESSDLTSITAEELVEVTITATVPLGVDTSFRMPITREDTGRVIYKLANIVDNVMTMVVALPTSGKWLVSEDQINGGLQGDGFTFSFVGLEVVAV